MPQLGTKVIRSGQRQHIQWDSSEIRVAISGSTLLLARAFDGADDGAGLVGAFDVLVFGDGVGDDAGAGLDVALLAIHVQGADGDAGIQIAGKIRIENRAAVDTAARGLQLLDDLHGADLGRAGERAGGEAGAEGVNGGEFGPEAAFERADQVHDVGVTLDEHQVLHLHAAIFGDAADVVAAEVDQHDVLGDFFFIRAQVGFEPAVFHLVSGARAGAGDGTVFDVAAMHADQQLGRTADDVVHGYFA